MQQTIHQCLADTWWLTLDNFGNGSDFQWPVQFRRQQQTSRISDAAYSNLQMKGCYYTCNATQFSGPVCAGARSSVIFSVKASCTYLVICDTYAEDYTNQEYTNCGGRWERLLKGGVFLSAYNIPYFANGGLVSPKQNATRSNFAKKTFTNSHKTSKFAKVFSLESFPLYGMHWAGTALQVSTHVGGADVSCNIHNGYCHIWKHCLAPKTVAQRWFVLPCYFYSATRRGWFMARHQCAQVFPDSLAACATIQTVWSTSLK